SSPRHRRVRARSLRPGVRLGYIKRGRSRADAEVVAGEELRPLTLTRVATLTWILAVALAGVGGFVAWLMLSISLCEDVRSSGADQYCNYGGADASGKVLGVLVISSIAVPILGISLGRRTVFWVGLAVPPVLELLVILAAARSAG
ncbi:MAG: hypothetical protein ACRDNB_09780, partial [Gaiellaceae bacterium]